jgi:hypothetical protein
MRIALASVGAVMMIPVCVLAADQCLTCHQTLGDKPSALFKHDIHRERGITCAGCHGGDPTTDDMEKGMDRKAGFLGVPKGDQISRMCARCHADSVEMRQFHSTLPTDQFSRLQSSVHGALATTGREMITQCTRCHGAHGIVRIQDRASPVNPLNIVSTCSSCHSNAAFMRLYNPTLPVDQLDKYRTSVHGMKNAKGDPLVAECASCHGSHGILPVKDVKSKVYPTNLPETCSSCHSDTVRMKSYGIPTDQFEKYAGSVHGEALLEKGDLAAPACNSCHGNHGAVPPGVESISKVCGTCHVLNADLFSSSPHKQAFDRANLPECETCHGNHEILTPTAALLGTGPDAVCSRCHSDQADDAGYAAARIMRQLTDSLEASEDSARALVEQAEQRGMEITDAKFKLRDARQARLESRTMVHAFDVKRFRETVDKGLVTASFVAGEAKAAVDEYYFRRIGLGIATLIITVLAVSLYLYIRRIERRQAQQL